jgi:hypothetical protein
MTQTELTAINWIDSIIAERGIKEATQLMVYNVTKNRYFRMSNIEIETIWSRINEINPS